MAFLFQDQNQGIRNNAPRANAAVATVLFHPDFNRRLRNHTESADPSSGEEGARGLGLRHPYRRWGFSPRPENIGCPGWATFRNYDQTRAPGQVPWASGTGMSPCPQIEAPARFGRKNRPQKLTIRARRDFRF